MFHSEIHVLSLLWEKVSYDKFQEMPIAVKVTYMGDYPTGSEFVYEVFANPSGTQH